MRRPTTATAALALALALVLQSTTAFVLPSFRRAGGAVAPVKPTATRAWGAIRGVETFNAEFELSPESEAVLVAFLTGEEMLAEVVKQARCAQARFTGHLFQPVPYSPGTPLGMPPEFEAFHNNPQYAICNVPPPAMFKAKVFKPPRLCAVFEIEGLHPEEHAKILARRQARLNLAQQVAAAASVNDLQDTRVPAGAVVDRHYEPTPYRDRSWAGVGRAMREVVVHGLGTDEDDEADLDALVV